MTQAPPAPDPPAAGATPDPAPDPGHLNEVVLRGRVSAEPEARDLPSGDRLVVFRVVVDRPPDPARDRRLVDVIDVACWSRRTQRSAGAVSPGDLVEVTGALRRRFYAAGGIRASRYEVEAERVSRVSRRRRTSGRARAAT